MRAPTLAIIAIAATAAPLAAQLSVETGSGQSRLDQLPSSSLATFAGGFDAATPRLHLSLDGDVGDHVGLGVEGRFNGSALYRLATGHWALDLGPVVQSGQSIAAPWATTAAGELSAEHAFGPITAHASWDQGVAWTGALRTSWSRPNVAADLQIKSWRIGAAWQSTTNRIPLAIVGGGGAPITGNSDSLGTGQVHDIRDVMVRMAWGAGPWSMSARAGRRYGVSVGPETWWEGEGAVRVTPILSLVLRAGQLAADPMLASRGGGYTTAGVRLDLVRRGSAPDPAPVPPAALASIVRESPATVHLYLALPPSTRAATFTGDLTAWRAVALRRTDDGRWEIILPASAGVYRVEISTNGGPWQPPAGLPSRDDGFGGRVGLLVVP
ncbi:MAG TPA: hypothetical protein VGL65_04140 [Gemmatimonadales bacterium]|jgi:hypothetical protein